MSERSWSVYLLRCADGTLYCGVTNDVPRRLVAHARGRVKYTRGRLPVELAYVEPAGDRGQALKREIAWKRLRRSEKLARLSAAETAGCGAASCAEAPNSLSHKNVQDYLISLRSGRRRLRR